MQKLSQRGAIISLGLLIGWCLVWELWLAPIRPGGSLLALKACIAVIPLKGLLRGRRYTFQWSSMFILLYFLEGVMRSWADPFPMKTFALGEVVLSVIFFVCAITYAKSSEGKQSRV